MVLYCRIFFCSEVVLFVDNANEKFCFIVVVIFCLVIGKRFGIAFVIVSMV